MSWVDKIKSWFRPRKDRDREKFIENVGEENINKMADNMRDNIRLHELYGGPFIEEPDETVVYIQPSYKLAEMIAIEEGITIDEASRLLNRQKQMNTDEDFIEPEKENQKDKMQKLIDQKKNRTPFYKDENKRNWE